MSRPSRRRSPLLQLGAALVVILAALVAVLLTSGSSGSRPAPRSLESFFQDDDHLLYASTATVARTLDRLQRLGVKEIRATVLWRAIAPDPGSRSIPPGFDPADPADYPVARWAPYDRLAVLARARGIGVDFDLGAPGPLWAMARRPPVAKYADHWAPSAAEFGQFVGALATRYSGRYRGPGGSPLPRIDFWSIWNEPNQAGWLAPQWQTVAGRPVIESAVLYRAYVDAAFGALVQTGHGPGTDTILIGELAPEGSPGLRHTYDTAIAPLPFLRVLYCVDASYRPLTGAAAAAAACPRAGDPSAFSSANPGLFDATGFAHHPYSFFLAPNAQMSDPDFVPLSDLGRLERGLDTIFSSYGIDRRFPLYLTEYGYETNPPNPYRGVSPARQALYLNEAEYMAWQDPRVRAMSQFLLYDAPPDPSFPKGSIGYWSTFQTGLLYADGASKPSLLAYRLPIYLPDPVMGTSGRVLVWGRLRPAPSGAVERAQVQWRGAGGSYRGVSTVTTDNPSGVLTADVRLPGPGTVRIAWTAPGGHIYYSRGAAMRG